jgi:type I restriction enzyme S subunit
MTAKQTLKPKLRFHEYQDRAESIWELRSFEDIFVFSTGKNIKQAEASPDFRTPCIRYGELYHMYGEVITTIINRTNIDESELKFSDGDEILLPSAGEDPLDIGSASALTIKGVAIGRTINVLKPKAPRVYDQRFASYYINQKLRKRISSLARGASISNVYNSDLRILEINMPTLPEQRKIADFLTAVDGRIGQLSQKKALLEDYKKGVMQQLFTQALRFKDDHGNDFPEWEKKKLGEVGAFKNGINKDKSEFGFGTPFVNLMDVFGKRVLNQANFGLINSTEKERSSYDLRAGDVLFIRSSVKRTGVGEAIIIEENIEAAVYSGFLIRFRQKGQRLTSEFMTYCFASPAFRKELLSYATTSANTNINQESLAEVAVAIPSLPEQTKIANFLTALDRKIESVSQQITHTQTFKKGLLQQMFV